MHLTPFVQVDDLPFSTTRAALLRRKGPPLRRFINDVALEVFDYGGVVFRFQASGRLGGGGERGPGVLVLFHRCPRTRPCSTSCAPFFLL